MKEESPADLVRRLMEAGYSQQEIADSVGCTQATISYIAQNKRETPRYTIVDALRTLALQAKAGDKAAKRKKEEAHE